ncbi:hypothetical protein VNO78_06039 [Psophocarpus tetragonolobus]|uniref:Wound-responsive family protein n=1 Tax=Psophocarpus tetragonolobus TaxID=3891 RepID=A0AAN9SSM2_PSOTE
MVSTSSGLKGQNKSEESLSTCESAKLYSPIQKNYKMSSNIRAWSVAASVGVVEALIDQGMCRWNHAFRSAQQHLKSRVGSFSHSKKLPSSSSAALVSTRLKNNKAKHAEESLRTVMYLSCWGPN